LLFWTLSLHFNLAKKKEGFYITDKHGILRGILYPDGLEEATFFNSPGPFELIALSATPLMPWVLFDGDIENIGARGEDSMLSQKAFYNVMALEWSGSVAERRGIGVLRQDAVMWSLPPGPA
jgi:hypothetical protein